MRRCLAALLLLFIIATGQTALANTTPMTSVGPHLQPVKSTTVRLAEERIEINVHRKQSSPTRFSWEAIADYRIWFRMVPSADEDLTLGFPLLVRYYGNYGARIQELKVLVDGQEVPTQTRRGENGEGEWATFQVTFHKDRPVEIVITYAMPVTPLGTQAGDIWIAYVLQTGSSWAGSIGRVEAILTMDKPIREQDIRTAEAGPSTTPGWKLADGTLNWVWEDVEPNFDLSAKMANTYWLDTPADIQAMLNTDVYDRDTLLRLMHGMSALYIGDARSGYWLAMRDGVSSEQAGEPLLPGLLDLVQSYISEHPKDWAVRDAHLRLVRESAWHYTLEGAVLLSEERLALFFQELHRWVADGGPNTDLRKQKPWLEPVGRTHPWADETQAAIVMFLIDEMDKSFMTEKQAREWIAQNAGSALSEEHADALLTEALGRVNPPEPGPKPDLAPMPLELGQKPLPAVPSQPPEDQGSGTPDWVVWAGGVLLIFCIAMLVKQVKYRSNRRIG